MTNFKNIILFLFIFALFLGATVEISEGSIPLGIFLLLIALALISRIKVGKSHIVPESRLHMLLGVLILVADIAYNILTQSSLGTLDIMTFMLGISLVAYDIKNEEISRMGAFGTYMSTTFLLLFIPLFIIFGRLDIAFMHIFDHYFVLLPMVKILNVIGIPVEVLATETVHIPGVEEMNVVIGGPCSGLYSMFLLVGIMVGYMKIEQIERHKFYSLLGITVIVAYFANLMRVTAICLAAFFYGKEVMYMVHVHLGWIVFVIVVAILLYILNKMADVKRSWH
ncbi:MAG: archaeosortase C, PEF-CTERM variant [Candidatus Syntrophoarchaeum caldarius]|uniref:Archaeosortase C, PEF-CTERM variant n=1 Tax=Candidatus Syntropharchaeum caldarium TaxID=1838285 RepID=A0A1F2PBE6_9EURY|nr:MAG: archaeosortase C, PEF-CTERM variant [Candidatus Syntrophoarchaeum caldarius]